MNDDACLGAAFRWLDVPALRRRRHQHLPRGRTDTAQRVVVERGRPAAAGELLTELRGIERRLLDAHVSPIDVELLGDDHRQHRLDALADLRVLRHDGDDAVRRNADVGVERGCAFTHGARRRFRHPDARQRLDHRMQQQAAASDRGRLQEHAARRQQGRCRAGGAALGRFRSRRGAHDVHRPSEVGMTAARLIAARMRV